MLVCTWRHGFHVGSQEQKHFSPLGTKLYFHVNSSRKYSFVLTPNMVALSRGCKPRIHLIFSKFWLRALTLDFHDIHWLESEFHYFGQTLMIMFPSFKFAFVSTAESFSITAKITAALFHWFCGISISIAIAVTLLFIDNSRYKVARIPSPLFTFPEFASAGIGQHSNWNSPFSLICTLFNVYPTNPSERGLYTNEDVLFIRA